MSAMSRVPQQQASLVVPSSSSSSNFAEPYPLYTDEPAPRTSPVTPNACEPYPLYMTKPDQQFLKQDEEGTTRFRAMMAFKAVMHQLRTEAQ